MGSCYVKLGDTVHFDVVTHSPSGGNVQNADETPKFWVFEEDTDAPVIDATNLTLRSGRVGLYRGSIAATIGNGFEGQKWYDVIASGKVDGVAGVTVALHFLVETNTFDDIASTSGIVRQNLDKTFYILDPSQSGQFVYYADVRFHKDNSNSRDEYSVDWFRNSGPVPSSQITIPVLQVINVTDGTDLIASGGMSYVNINIGTVKFYEASSRTTAGENYVAKVSATIDGTVRNWVKLVGRDS